MEKIEILLGRKLTKMEMFFYETYKDDIRYRFEKAENGSLMAVLKDEFKTEEFKK